MNSPRSRSLLLSAALLAGLACQALAQHHEASAKPSQLDLMKKLAGDWTGKGKDGMQEFDAKVNYKVTSGGSAVVETIDPGGQHEMVTIYTMDGDDLVLTHYCMLGNQPRMKAEKGTPHKLVFKFVGGGNLKSEKDDHMHDMTLEWIDADHIKADWSFYKDGKSTMHAVFDLTRKK